jgi:hypothetical protein
VEMPHDMFARPEPYEQRRGKQIRTPAFPTTTIGSFPQTPGESVQHCLYDPVGRGGGWGLGSASFFMASWIADARSVVPACLRGMWGASGFGYDKLKPALHQQAKPCFCGV